MLLRARDVKYCPFFQLQMKLDCYYHSCYSLFWSQARFIYFHHELLVNYSLVSTLCGGCLVIWFTQHMSYFWMDGRVFLLLYCLIIFLSDQLQIDHAEDFKISLNEYCNLWNTNICRTFLVWKWFKYLVTTLPMSNKEQQNQCLYCWKHLLTIDSKVWSALSNKQNFDTSVEGSVFYLKKK